jgi:hypothetical protein
METAVARGFPRVPVLDRRFRLARRIHFHCRFSDAALDRMIGSQIEAGNSKYAVRAPPIARPTARSFLLGPPSCGHQRKALGIIELKVE